MLFQRRIPETVSNKARNWIWPKQGWVRTLKYYKYRAIRIEDSSYSIAAGLAFGCAISFTPAFGTHLLQSALFCWIFRANWLAAALATTFGNPLTFPILWSISYYVGIGIFRLLDFIGLFDMQKFITGSYSFARISEIGNFIIDSIVRIVTFRADQIAELYSGYEYIHSASDFFYQFWLYLFPILVGGYITGALFYPVFYYPFRAMIRAARQARKKLITKKAHRVAKEVTGQTR